MTPIAGDRRERLRAMLADLKPVEWLWRALTYRRCEPLRRATY